MRRRGLLDEAALGLAEAVCSDRAFAGVVLVVSTLLFRDIRWIVGASFLAGAALRGTSWKLRWPLIVAAGVVLWRCAGPFAGTWSADHLGDHPWARVGMPLRVALMLLCAGGGMRSLTLTALGVAGATAACLIRNEAAAPWMAGLLGISLVVLVLGAFGLPRVAIAVGVVAAFGDALFLRPLSWQLGVALVTGVVLAGWIVLACLAVRASGNLGARTETARLLVVCQRFPWAALSAVAAVVLFHDATMPLMSGGITFDRRLVSMMIVSFGASFVASLGARSPTALGALAAPFWLSMALMLTWAVSRSSGPVVAIGLTATTVLWPAAVAQILRSSPLSLRSQVVHALVAALAVTPAAVVYFVLGRLYSDQEWVWEWTWVAIAPIAFHAAVGIEAPSRRLVLAAVGVGAASMLAIAVVSAAMQSRDSLPLLNRNDVLALIGVWFLGGVYVVIARRARSLSAVPVEPDP